MAFAKTSFHMVIFTPIDFFSNSLKLRNYRSYIFSIEIGSTVISIASSVINLIFKKQVNQIIQTPGQTPHPEGHCT